MENNDQNINTQVNTNNNGNQQEPNNTNKIVIILMALVIVGLAGYIIYTKFIQKDDNTKETNPTPTPIVTPKPTDNNQQVSDDVITKLDEYELDENNKEFVINNKTILLKVVDGKLFINNKECDSYHWGLDKVYLTNHFIIIEGGGQSVFYPAMINQNCDLIEIDGNPDTPTTSIEGLYLENGKLLATKYIDNGMEEESKTIKVELVYKNNKITIKDVQ